MDGEYQKLYVEIIEFFKSGTYLMMGISRYEAGSTNDAKGFLEFTFHSNQDE